MNAETKVCEWKEIVSVNVLGSFDSRKELPCRGCDGYRQNCSHKYPVEKSESERRNVR